MELLNREIHHIVHRYTQIRNLLAQNNLRRGISLGSLSEIAEQIDARQKEINKVVKALEYGSQIELRICIESTRKRYEETNLCEEKLFKYYNLHFAEIVSSPANSNKVKANDETSEFNTQSNNKLNNYEDVNVIIYPSHTYLWILFVAEEILGFPPENSAAKGIESLELRILEVRALMIAINQNIKLNQPEILETIAILTPTSTKQLQAILNNL